MAASSTSIYGFKFSRSLYGVDLPIAQEYIIKDSSTITLGDAVRLSTDGYLKRSATGEPILGIVVGLVDKNGINVFETGRASGTTGATLTPDDTLGVSSTNSSDATRNLKAQVLLDPAGGILFKNTASAALAATNVGQLFDVGSNSGQIDQGSASDTSGQFQLVALDPDTTTVGLFRIMESQLPAQLGNSTAVVTA